MQDRIKEIDQLINCIEKEAKAQEDRYNLESGTSIKVLKNEGLILHPISVRRKYFGFADYPEIEINIPGFCDPSNFRASAAIECFLEGEEIIKGIYLGGDNKSGSIRLFAPDFPDWIEDKGVGIKLAADQHTIKCMKDAIKAIPQDDKTFDLFKQIYGYKEFSNTSEGDTIQIDLKNKGLNPSQIKAVEDTVNFGGISIIHGPPGTGKTTTVVEAIVQNIKIGRSVIVTAPSNAAVDNLADRLITAGVKILRVGNTSKVDDRIYPYTVEGKLKDSKMNLEIKKLRIRAEEFRRMAQQYKRRFGKEERDQRNLLYKEIKSIRAEIKALKNYHEEKLFDEAEVIVGTPIGLKNELTELQHFDILFIDEAGQALEPLAWMLFPYADQWVLCGDPLQLPPTVLSEDAKQLGFNISILERAYNRVERIDFLDTQYRMYDEIAAFSSAYFYNGNLKSAEHLLNKKDAVEFYDTAGTGFLEEQGEEGMSLSNPGEVDLIQKIIERDEINPLKCGVISPYSGQIRLAKQQLSSELRISTIDSFQGQEMPVIILSLVRSNDSNDIGFLKDYRRMNVALTRAQVKLYVIGDSATLAGDAFYDAYLDYIEKTEAYHSAWELIS